MFNNSLCVLYSLFIRLFQHLGFFLMQLPSILLSACKRLKSGNSTKHMDMILKMIRAGRMKTRRRTTWNFWSGPGFKNPYAFSDLTLAFDILNQEFQLFSRTTNKHFLCFIHHIIVVQLEIVKGFSHNGNNTFLNKSNIKTPEYNFIQAI